MIIVDLSYCLCDIFFLQFVQRAQMILRFSKKREWG
jgi:hypothetical protein